MTPADELRAAAAHLRAATLPTAITATPAMASLLRAREPLAAWLDFHAAMGDRMRALFDDDLPTDEDIKHPALAVARALLGTTDGSSR